MIKKISKLLSSKKFTRWYIGKGYLYELHFWKCYTLASTENFSVYRSNPTHLYLCPWWVKPLLIFFDPDEYDRVVYGAHTDPVGAPGHNGIEDRFEEVKSFEDFYGIIKDIVK